MDILERINRTPIDGQLLAEANAVHAALPADDRGDLDAMTMAMVKFLQGKGLAGEQRRDLLQAVSFRLEALACITVETNSEMQAWTLRGDEKGTDYVQLDVFDAAAQEPLIEKNGHVGFNPETFFARLLAISQESGRA